MSKEMNLDEAIVKWIIVFVWTVVEVCVAKISSIVAPWCYRLFELIVGSDQIFQNFPDVQENFLSRSYYWHKGALYDLGELLHWFDRVPSIGQRFVGKWELVALARYSKSYNGRRCRPATICDLNMLDDEFWPDHLSSVYNVEARNMNFGTCSRKFVIRSVSLLSGARKNVHEFETEAAWYYAHPSGCFQSNGAILIVIDRCLYVYDYRYRMSKKFEMPSTEFPIGVNMLVTLGNVSVSCLRRFRSADGRLEGWKIRIVQAHFEHPTFENFSRARLTNRIFDLREKAEWISGQEIVFGKWPNLPLGRQAKFVRTMAGSFGMHVGDIGQWGHAEDDGGDGPTMLYDEATNTYAYRANLQELQQDKEIAVYNTLWMKVDDVQWLRPIFLSKRECVKCFDDGRIVRREFVSSSLKFLSAKKLFRSRPSLRKEMNADQFRKATGIKGMEAHFDT